MNQKVSNKITCLYFVLCLMILNLHSAYMELFEPSSIALSVNKFVRIVCNMGVPTFFFMSALLFYRSVENKSYIGVVKSKARSLIVPYLCWNVICFPLKELKNVSNGGVTNLNIAEVVYKIIMSAYDPVLWFIRVLFIYFLVYPLILWIIKRRKLVFLTIVVLLSINLYLGPTTGYSSCRYWMPIYLYGAYLGYWKREEVFGTKIQFKWSKVISALIVVFLLWIAAFNNKYGMYICRMLSPICYWTLADVFLSDLHICWFMKQTFFFYSAQMIFSIIAQKIYVFVAGKGMISAIASNLIIPLLLMLILCTVAYWFNKLLPRIYMFLTGGRN